VATVSNGGKWGGIGAIQRAHARREPGSRELAEFAPTPHTKLIYHRTAVWLAGR